MTTAEQEKRKRLIAIVLGSVAALLLGYQLYNAFGSGSSSSPPPPPVIVTAGGAKAAPVRGAGSGSGSAKALTSAQLDPSLHMEAMLVTESLVYSGSGRNIFSGEVEAPVIELPTAEHSARNTDPHPPPPPNPCPPTCPPPPIAPVPFKFFGTATSASGTRRAFLLSTSGDDVVVALAGDIVQRRYRVVSIAADSVLVEDIPNANKQTLPLTKVN